MWIRLNLSSGLLFILRGLNNVIIVRKPRSSLLRGGRPRGNLSKNTELATCVGGGGGVEGGATPNAKLDRNMSFLPPRLILQCDVGNDDKGMNKLSKDESDDKPWQC